MLRFFIYLSITLNISNCTTRDNRDEDVTKLESTNTPSQQMEVRANTAKYNLSSEISPEVYKTMLKANLGKENSQKTKNNQLVNTTKGMITCKFQPGFNNCFYHTRNQEDKLIGPYSLPKKMLKPLVTFFKENTNIEENIALKADLICDYIGRNSPPYGVEKLDCNVYNPRNLNETYFEGKTANKIAEVLNGAQSYGKSVTTLNGSILCQWIKGTKRTPCVVRPLVKGVLLDKFLEISSRYSNKIAKKLLETLKDAYDYGNISNKNFDKPTEIIGTIICNVDSKDFESFGKRKIICKINV